MRRFIASLGRPSYSHASTKIEHYFYGFLSYILRIRRQSLASASYYGIHVFKFVIFSPSRLQIYNRMTWDNFVMTWPTLGGSLGTLRAGVIDSVVGRLSPYRSRLI